MIKLMDLLESPHKDVVCLFELPLKMSVVDYDPNKLNSFGKNSTFTLMLKQYAKLIGKLDEFDIYEYSVGNYIINVLVKNNNSYALFMYSVEKDIAIEEKIWQDPISIGLCRKFIFEYILKKYSGLLSDDAHTELGQKYWDKLLQQALNLGYKIFVVDKDKKIKLDNDYDINIYYNNSAKSTDYKFLIQK